MTQTEEIMVELTTYHGNSIQVNHNGYFITVLGGEAMDAPNLHALKERIDDFMRAQAKSLSVDLAVLDGEGSACRIIGVNLGSGKVVTRPSGAKGPFVVNLLNNADLVAKYISLNLEIAELRLKLKDRQAMDHFGYGRITSDEYPVKMRELQNSYDVAVEITREDHEFAEAVDRGIAKANERFADAE